MKKNDTIRKDATIVAETPVSASVSESNAPKKKRRFNRRTLFKAMFVVSIIFIMISLTYAWFSLSDTANVNGVDLGFTEANSLVAEGVFTKGKIDSVTGNGTSFYKPVMEKQLVGTSNGQNLYKLVKGDTYEQQTDDVTSVNSVVDNVLTVDFTLNIVGKHNIYLVMGSGVSPDGAGAEFLEGAMRVAILKLNEETQKYELCTIWIPDVTSSKNGNSGLDSTYTFVNPINEGEEDESAVEETVTISTDHGSAETPSGIRYAWGKIDGITEHNVFVDELDESAKYRCVIWLDGNDRECDNELLDTDIVATFKFFPEAVDESESE
ncbi:MAG: hypothetical protein E7678_00580 [Ruminococcaceae bacterium]|nr:hypothetical protein [Oscillospiraceae bacterium]